METTFSAYIIFSEKRQKFYVGMSSEPEKRLNFHNLGLNTSTRGGSPWTLVWKSIPMAKSEALALEKRIKKRGAGRFLADLGAR